MSAQARVIVDHTHCGRRVTGLERITLELFSREALDREVAIDLMSGLLQGEATGALPMLSSLVDAVSARDRALLDDLERLVAEKRGAIAREGER